ncbi:hypothetical protein CRG98_002756 [Punica granatum]|uniref:Protein XRI1 n=1 Tax=Punica granatum TaxID=22663 RepID=A0A2I0L812_PUNGR|nr:hypothetical protein CRG98_002756 [Punica granatum]
MDCDDNGGAKPWNWQPEEDSFQKDTNFDISQCIWTEVTQNEEDISYMFDETTPVKACGDLAYNAAGSGNMNKELEECSQSYLQVKRRRMLQFDSHSMDPSLCCHETSSAFLRSDERDDSIEEVFPNASQLNSRRPEFWNDQPDSNVARVQQVNRTPQKIVFRGRKSYIRPPPKLASSVAYPFAFIKPCGAHGDVTLKDINQRIRTPPPHKTKQSNEDPSASYPTSAFSGKPVVGKMKIRTEGGKGSITVMRTKG